MSRWDLLPKNIIDLIFQFDPTFHNIHKDNLKFLQKIMLLSQKIPILSLLITLVELDA